mmetsp:Transcript_2626/g.4004  ORF Transcript_2626/g.4004 Transcript_2626/m.4004 type:complete len:86 (+) Transcript_2626:333-590(+)
MLIISSITFIMSPNNHFSMRHSILLSSMTRYFQCWRTMKALVLLGTFGRMHLMPPQTIEKVVIFDNETYLKMLIKLMVFEMLLLV